MSKDRVVKIGIFVPSEVDTASIDVLAVMSREYLSLLDMVPAHVTAAAPRVSFHYISLPGKATVGLTAGMTMTTTHDLNHPDVQPGQLDILFIPGPDPAAQHGDDVKKFVRGHFENKETDILSVCTGIYLCGAAGILEGRKASGPRGLQSDIKKKFPGVKLVGENYRWVQDGNLWSSGESACTL
jgi:transcriptional regulator GlxA family with amidase domain